MRPSRATPSRRPPAPPSLHSESFVQRRTWVLVLALCLPALIPTLLPGWFEGHDDLHIYRVIEYDVALRDGQIPPRWFPDVSAGYGNAHPIYYAPLFYLVAEAPHLLGADVILSLKGAIVVFTLLSALFMYGWARQHWGRAASLVAAAAYTYAPYHMLDLYVRKAFSEYTVFAFLPAMMLAFHQLFARGTRWDLLAAALSVAAMSTAHTITTMIVPPLLGAYVLFLAWRGGSKQAAPRWRWLARAGAATALGYALAGFFLVPALLEKDFINLKVFTEGYVNFHKHFVYPLQLLWWPWGFGMSSDGLKDDMSFRLGLILLAGIVMAAAGLRRLPRRETPPLDHIRFCLGVTAVALLLTLPVSTIFWELAPPMKFVQFPWRFLMLATLTGAFLCAAAFTAYATQARAGAREREPWTAALVVCVVVVLEAALGGTLAVHQRIPVGRVGFEEKPYNNMIDRGPGAPPETLDAAYVRGHTLHWIDHLPLDVSFMGLNQTDLDRPKVELEQGRAAVSLLRARSTAVSFHLECETPARVRVNIYRFPGWTARVDGTPAKLVMLPSQRRVLFFDVAAGPHDVVVSFDRTTPRLAGDLLSLAGLCALAVVGLWPASPRESKTNQKDEQEEKG